LTRDERIRAFALRCDGATWEQIGRELHYEPNTVRTDLLNVVKRGSRIPAVLYPAVRRYLLRRHSGSINAFAKDLHVNPHELRKVIVYGAPPGKTLKKKLIYTLQTPEEEVFSRDTSPHDLESPSSPDSR